MAWKMVDDGQPSSGDYASAHAVQLEAKIGRLCSILKIDPSELEPPKTPPTALSELYAGVARDVAKAMRHD